MINDNWTVIQPSYAVNIDRATERIAYRVDNAMDHIFLKVFDSDDFVVSHMYAVADLMAIVNAHDNDPEIGRPQVSSTLLKRKEVENHSFLHTMATWFKYCGWFIVTGGCAFLLFRLFGGRSIISKGLGLCGLPGWVTSLLSFNIGDLIGSKKNPEQTQQLLPTTTTIINMPQAGVQTKQEEEEEVRPARLEKRPRRSSRRRRRSAD